MCSPLCTHPICFSAGSSYLEQLLGWFYSVDGVNWTPMGTFASNRGWCDHNADFSTYLRSPSGMTCASCVQSGSYSVTIPLPTDTEIEWFAFSWGHTMEPREIQLSGARMKCS